MFFRGGTWRGRFLAFGVLSVRLASFSPAPLSAQSNECPYDRGSQPSPRVLWKSLSLRPASPAAAHEKATAPIARRNFIDEEIFGELERARIAPAPLSSDEEFLRRVTLDLTGELPDPGVVRRFVADASDGKRDRAIDALLHSDAFVDRWAMWFGDLVQNVQLATNVRLFAPARNAYAAWIRGAIQSGRPYDLMVQDLLTGQGSTFERGVPNYVLRQVQGNGPVQDTFDNLAVHSAERFLGIQAGCLSCHDGAGHLDAVNLDLAKRTRVDFWESAAFFARVRVTGVRDGAEFKYRVADDSKGEYLLNTSFGNKTPRQPPAGEHEYVLPRFFLNGERPGPYESYRASYARLLTSHPQFARSTVNRLFKELFSLGLVEPVDAFDLARQDPERPPPVPWVLQPSHPRLLNQLAQAFVASGYDLRSVLGLMVRSSAYQLSSRYPGSWNEEFAPFFARHYPRRLWAEEVLDALFKATGIPPAPADFRVTAMESARYSKAMSLPDPTEPDAFGKNTYRRFLDSFGRGNRSSSARTSDGSLVQGLHLLNDLIVTERVKRSTPGSAVAAILESARGPREIVEELYLRTLSRFPTAAEKEEALRYLSGEDSGRRAEDLQFALLNHVEFLFSH